MQLASEDVERIFREAGALQDGHFVLASGRHSPTYLDKFRVLQHPAQTERLCAAIAPWAAALDVAAIAGPTTGGVILAHELARQLGRRAIYAERREGGEGREFRRGFALAPEERVLVIDDILTTGGSLRETVEAVGLIGGTVCGAAVLVDRSGGAVGLGVPLRALWQLDIPTYAPPDCPLCAAGIPATHPGTTPAPAGAAR
jgi:orotate phosphoribosyltransferase